MKADLLFDTLQNLIKFKPSQQMIADILGVRQSVIGNRVSRNSNFSDEEIAKIESHFAIRILEKVTPEDVIEADYYTDVFASCGGGSFALSEAKEKIRFSKTMVSDYSASTKYFVINSVGDSMQPFIYDKDKLIVAQNTGEPIRDNRIYVFCYDDKIFIKRLVQNINQITVISDNPDKELYPTQVIKKLDTFKIIGQIVGIMRDVR